jgi:hypothetical protein
MANHTKNGVANTIPAVGRSKDERQLIMRLPLDISVLSQVAHAAANGGLSQRW